jgi:hypothetical protein
VAQDFFAKLRTNSPQTFANQICFIKETAKLGWVCKPFAPSLQIAHQALPTDAFGEGIYAKMKALSFWFKYLPRSVPPYP